MLRVNRQTRRLIAVSLTSCLALASIGPGIAIACEGGEAQTISLTPVESGTGKMVSGNNNCPENAGKTEVVFKAATEWCEYEVKNETVNEAVIIKQELIGQPAECEFGGGKYCLINQTPKEKECEEGVTVLVKNGGKCFDRVEYEKKPVGKPKGTFRVTTKGQTSGIEATTPTRDLKVE
jgi:hypothetical protein